MAEESSVLRKRKAVTLSQVPSVTLTQLPSDGECFQETVQIQNSQLRTEHRAKCTPATQVDDEASTACLQDDNQFFHQNGSNSAEVLTTTPQPIRKIVNKHLYSPAYLIRNKTDSPLEIPCFSTSLNSLNNIRRAPVAILNIDRLVTYLISTQPTATNALARKKTIRVLHNLKDSLDVMFK